MTSQPPARTPGEAADEQDAQAAQAAAGAAAGAAGSVGSAGGSRAPRRALALALPGGALGAALTLVAAGQVWTRASASFAQGALPVRAEGSEISGLPSALALVGLAALVAVFAVRRAGRFLVAGLLALCGAGVLGSALLGADDTSALDDKAAQASGLAQSTIDAVHVSAWPYVSAGGGALLLLAGALALRYGRGWPSMSGSGRYERTSRRPRRTAPEAVDPDRPEDLWKALDRGEDPT